MSRGARARRADELSAPHTPRRLLALVLGARGDHRGQSLVEFALILPILLLLTLIAIDFGRVYLGWINLQNMARIGANFAANNAGEDWTSGSTNFAKYANQMSGDASATNCPLAPGQPGAPVFTDIDGVGGATSLGDRVAVTLTCRFHVITPLISFIVGSNLNVTVTSVFPVKSATVEGPSGGGGGGGGCLPPSAGINATPGTSGTARPTCTFRIPRRRSSRTPGRTPSRSSRRTHVGARPPHRRRSPLRRTTRHRRAPCRTSRTTAA
jgi:Flp pilus assembly protein TadG